MTFGIGEFYSLSSAFIWAVAVILFKKSGESLNPFALNLFKNVLALTLLGLTIAVLAPHPPQPWNDALSVESVMSSSQPSGLTETRSSEPLACWSFFTSFF